MKKFLGLLAAVVMMFALSACGDSATTGSAAKDKEKVEVGEKAEVKLTEDNFFDVLMSSQVAAGSSRMVMNMAMGGETMQMDARVQLAENLEDLAMTMSMDMGIAQTELILVDGFMYMNMGKLTDNKYIKTDLANEADKSASEFKDLAKQMDPAEQLKNVKKAKISVKKLGDGGELDGVSTTKWEVTVDTSKMELDENTAALAPKTMTYLMWIGEDNLPRRQTYNINDVETEILFTEWGQKFTITAPGADKITESPLA
ncbi:MAG: hypothetical protein E6Q27_03020 [Aeromicrobium sp.]|nr:MAG: hypothetical protein E6Q27_03020 [Aeromicrobium sp.]